jgi:hypothetical protein
MPAELVGRAIAYAESEPGIESVPGWVVEALRRHRDEGWPIPVPRTKQIGLTGRDRPIDIEKYTSGAYGDLFRRGSDTSGLENSSFEGEACDAVLSGAGALAPLPAKPPVGAAQCTEVLGVVDALHPSAVLPRTVSTDDVFSSQVRQELMLRCGRKRGPVIAGLRVHIASRTTLLICATFEDMAIVQNELIGAL